MTRNEAMPRRPCGWLAEAIVRRLLETHINPFDALAGISLAAGGAPESVPDAGIEVRVLQRPHDGV